MKLDKKQYRIILSSIVISGIVCLFAIVRFTPHVSDSTAKVSNEILEEQRRATKEQIQARKEMIEQAERTIEYLKSRDSAIGLSLDNNTKELKRIHDDKKTVDYTDYRSEQLQHAVADAARQYRAGR